MVDDGEVKGRIELYRRCGDSVEAIGRGVAGAGTRVCSQVVDIKAHIKIRDFVQIISSAKTGTQIVVVKVGPWRQSLIYTVEALCRTASTAGSLLVALALPSHAGVAALLSRSS
jgi:hypothetical protein